MNARGSAERIDGYLLGERVSKPGVVVAILQDRSSAPAAAPFYRALEAVGARAADEAFVALRLVLAGREPTDAAVRRLRALSQIVRAAAVQDAAGVATAYERNRGILSDLPPGEALASAAEAAYRAELGAS